MAACASIWFSAALPLDAASVADAPPAKAPAETTTTATASEPLASVSKTITDAEVRMHAARVRATLPPLMPHN